MPSSQNSVDHIEPVMSDTLVDTRDAVKANTIAGGHRAMPRSPVDAVVHSHASHAERCGFASPADFAHSACSRHPHTSSPPPISSPTMSVGHTRSGIVQRAITEVNESASKSAVSPDACRSAAKPTTSRNAVSTCVATAMTVWPSHELSSAAERCRLVHTMRGGSMRAAGYGPAP